MTKVLLWKYHKKEEWWRDIAAKAIVFFTQQPFTHAAIYHGGATYESTVWKEGRKLRHGALRAPEMLECDVILGPVEELTIGQNIKLQNYLDQTIYEARPYNFFKLVALAVIYPTRWFWNLIGWVPFSHDMYGEVCSVYVDEAFKAIGIDLLPYHDEQYTSPGDLLFSPRLQ